MGAGMIRASLFKETMEAIKTALPKLWPWIVVFGFVMGIYQLLFKTYIMSSLDLTALRHVPTAAEIKANPEIVRQSLALQIQNLKFTMSNAGGVLVIQALASYIFSVSYLRLAMKKNQPVMNLSNFMHWLGQVIWKYLKPCLWILIPFVGVFIYTRSIVRYAAVTPMAILGRGPELKNSWQLTENNWWRIFWNSLGVGIVMLLIIWGCALIPYLIVFFVAHANSQAPLVTGFTSLCAGFWSSIAVMAGSIYSCTLYRILMQEGRAGAAPSAPPSN